jgi:flagellar biosynthetic protein FlhB
MAESDMEKTERATPRRRQEARQDGNVARSNDLTAAVSLLAAVLLLNLLGSKLFMGMKVAVEAVLGGATSENPTRPQDLSSMFAFLGRVAVESTAPLVVALAAVALVATVGQVGFMFTGKPLMPDLTKLSPLRGVKQLIDARAWVRLVMSLAKVAAITGVAVWAVYTDTARILILAELEAAQMFWAGCSLVYTLALKLAALLILIAIVDYVFQSWKREQDLRMSKHEVKEEMKRMEGDPLVKQRRTRVARQLALQRIGQAVPKADVVVTNPTHFAVALKYDNQSMRAPKVVAKGADFMAMRIRQLAVANGVPLVERKELARALYRTVEIGQEIPPEFFNAVAEILAYVYRLSGKRSA